MSFNTALVIGAGAFGTCIASVLANNFDKVLLKVRSKDVYDALMEGENSIYLPGAKLSDNIIPCLDWEQVDKHGTPELLVSGLPSSAIKRFYTETRDRFEGYFDQGIPMVSLSKGIDPETLELSDDLFYDLFPHHRDQFLFLSGPSFAREIMSEQITLVTIAGKSKQHLDSMIKMFNCGYFKIFPSYDIKGVLLGGALKNILAIAGGVIEGLGYNHNTRAAMITRGIAEMLRFGQVYNARPETFYGLSGMGDLILTTTGDLSRNKLFGLEIAKGRKADQIISSQRSVVEGYKTAKAAHLIAEKFDIRSNIFHGVYNVLYEGKDPRDEITRIMRVPSTFE